MRGAIEYMLRVCVRGWSHLSSGCHLRDSMYEVREHGKKTALVAWIRALAFAMNEQHDTNVPVWCARAEYVFADVPICHPAATTAEISRTVFVPFKRVPHVSSHSPSWCLRRGVLMSLVLHCPAHSVEHLGTAPTNIFVMCSCFLSCDSTSTLYET